MKQLRLFKNELPPAPVETRTPQEIYRELEAMPRQQTRTTCVFRLCAHAICNRDIDSTEAIDWLIERGVSEDKAHGWAMNRFYGGRGDLNNVLVPLKGLRERMKRSKQKRAA